MKSFRILKSSPVVEIDVSHRMRFIISQAEKCLRPLLTASKAKRSKSSQTWGLALCQSHHACFWVTLGLGPELECLISSQIVENDGFGVFGVDEVTKRCLTPHFSELESLVYF